MMGAKLLNDNCFSDLGLAYTREILKENDSNVVFSPVSVEYLIYLILLGADGDTKQTLLKQLKIDHLDMFLQELFNFSRQLTKHTNALNMLNLGLIDNSIFMHPIFGLSAQRYCLAQIESVDFKGAPTFPELVARLSKTTQGKITTLPRFSPATKAALINLMSFSLPWKNHFRRENQIKGKFMGKGKDQENVSFLCGTADAYIENDTFEGIKLAYSNPDYMFVALMPKQDLDTSLDTLLSVDNVQEEISDLLNYLSPQEVTFELPKFKMENKLSVTEATQQLGLGELFAPGIDLSVMCPHEPNFYINSLEQVCKIEVTAKGTRAKAVSTAALMNCYKKNISFNKPFLYGIQDLNTNKLIYIGKCYTISK